MVSALTAAEILQAWERGAPRNSGGRGLVMLAAAHPGLGADALAGLTVGRRDALLLELRERTFGPEMAATARCPACAEALEFTLRTSDIRQQEIASLRPAKSGPDSARNDSESILSGVPASSSAGRESKDAALRDGRSAPSTRNDSESILSGVPASSSAGRQSKDAALRDGHSAPSTAWPEQHGHSAQGAPFRFPDAQPEVFQWSRPGCQVTFRLPTAGDLEAIGDGSIGDGSIGDGSIGDGSALLARCVLAAELDGAAVTGGALPDDVAAGVAAAIGAAAAEHDPQAEILLNLACPVCGHAWQAPFDIAGFLWAEIAAQARRLLYEVDALARAYGWREADILALTPARRQAYLDMVQG